MTQTSGLKLLLVSVTLTTVVACGGGSSTPKPSASATSAQATQTGGVAGQTAAAGQTGKPPGTPGIGGSNTGPGPTGSSTAIPDASPPSVPFPGVTVFPDGTATNSEGTPVVLPTAQPEATDVAATTPGVTATAGASAGATISIASPADATGDFDVDVRIDGVTKPYVVFNVYITFDPAILTATVTKPGTALSASSFKMFCARAPDASGAIGLGCTVLQGPSAATNGLLATITFHPIGTGTTALHLRTVAEGSATTGTYISTPRQGSPQLVPDIVTLIDGAVTVS